MTLKPDYILDFSDVPPQLRSAAFRLFERHGINIEPIADAQSSAHSMPTNNTETFNAIPKSQLYSQAYQSNLRDGTGAVLPLQYVFKGKDLSDSLTRTYFRLIFPNLQQMGFQIRLVNPPVLKAMRYKSAIPVKFENGLIFNLSDIPPQNRQQIIDLFLKKNIKLNPLPNQIANLPAVFYHIDDKETKLFCQDEDLKKYISDNNITYAFPPAKVPPIKTEIPETVRKEREEKKQRAMEAKALYFYHKTMAELNPTPYVKLKQLALAGVSSAALLSVVYPAEVSVLADDLIHGRLAQPFNRVADAVAQIYHITAQPDFSIKKALREQKKQIKEGIRSNLNTLQEKPFWQLAADIGLNGAVNLASTAFSVTVSTTDSFMQLFHIAQNRYITTGNLTYDNFKKNPSAYFKNALVYVDKETGLRSDDTVFSLIDSGKAEMIQAYIKKDMPLNVLLENDMDPLNYAIAKNQPKIAEMIWETRKNSPYDMPKDGRTAFIRAIEINALTEDERLDGEIHAEKYSRDVLQKKAEMQSFILKMAESSRIVFSLPCPNGDNLAAWVVRCGNVDLIPVLEKYGVEFNENTNGEHLLHIAQNNPKAIKALLQKHTDVTNSYSAFEKVLLYSEKHPGKNDKAIRAYLEYFTPAERKELSTAPFYSFYLEKWSERNPEISADLLGTPRPVSNNLQSQPVQITKKTKTTSRKKVKKTTGNINPQPSGNDISTLPRDNDFLFQAVKPVVKQKEKTLKLPPKPQLVAAAEKTAENINPQSSGNGISTLPRDNDFLFQAVKPFVKQKEKTLKLPLKPQLVAAAEKTAENINPQPSGNDISTLPRDNDFLFQAVKPVARQMTSTQQAVSVAKTGSDRFQPRVIQRTANTDLLLKSRKPEKSKQ